MIVARWKRLVANVHLRSGHLLIGCPAIPSGGSPDYQKIRQFFHHLVPYAKWRIFRNRKDPLLKFKGSAAQSAAAIPLRYFRLPAAIVRGSGAKSNTSTDT